MKRVRLAVFGFVGVFFSLFVAEFAAATFRRMGLPAWLGFVVALALALGLVMLYRQRRPVPDVLEHDPRDLQRILEEGLERHPHRQSRTAAKRKDDLSDLQRILDEKP